MAHNRQDMSNAHALGGLRRAARFVAAGLVALLALVLAPLPTHAAPASTSDEPVIVVGLGAMRWREVDATATPNLLSLLAEPSAAAGSLVVRSVATLTCPADGWLTVSAGRRTTAEPRGTACAGIATHNSPARAADWATYVQTATDQDYGAIPGTLGSLLAGRDISAAALGPGAILALTQTDGLLADPTLADPEPLTPESISAALPGLLEAGTRVIAIDAASRIDDITRLGHGAAANPATADDDITTALDANLGAALAAARSYAATSGTPVRIVAAGLHDRHTRPYLHVFATARITPDGAVAPASEAGVHLISSFSTRQPGIAQSTDLLPSIASWLGVPTPATAVGSPIKVTADEPIPLAEFLAGQVDYDVHLDRSRAAVPWFYPGYIILVLALFALSARALRAPRVSQLAPRRHRFLALWAGTALAMPLGIYLVDLLPWWRASADLAPVLGLLGALAFAIGLSALALAVTARAARGLAGGRGALIRAVAAPALLATTLWLTLILDALAGAPLQRTAIMGSFATVGGRFYGMNNTSFVLLAVTSFIVAASLGAVLARFAAPTESRRRQRAAAAFVAIGLVTVVIDGAPSIGADFGGPPALIPGFAIATLVALGVALSLRRILAILTATVAAAFAISYLDYLRPPAQRTHLGRFMQSVYDGELIQVVGRKASANLHILTNSYFTILLAAALLILTAFLLGARTRRRNAPNLPAAEAPYGWLLAGPDALAARLTYLRPAALGIAVTLLIAFAVNDSGVVIPAIGLGLAVPAFIMIAHTWQAERVPSSAARYPEG